MQYLRKPKVIEAMQFTGDNAAAIFEWSKGMVSWAATLQKECDTLKMETKYGTGYAKAGTWVVRGSCGLYYPASDKEFKENYQALEPEACALPLPEFYGNKTRNGAFYIQFHDETVEDAITSHSASNGVFGGFNTVEAAIAEANISESKPTPYKILDCRLTEVCNGVTKPE
jgi:hypothetical protein